MARFNSHASTHANPCFESVIQNFTHLLTGGFGTLTMFKYTCTVLQAKSESDVMFCLQSYQGLRIDRSLVTLSEIKRDFPMEFPFLIVKHKYGHNHI